jgi:two-component system cell cycle sensor histidine kinase/response regulator CckA
MMSVIIVLSMLFHMVSLLLVLRGLRISDKRGMGWGICMALGIAVMLSHRAVSLSQHLSGTGILPHPVGDVTGLVIAVVLAVAMAFMNPIISLRTSETSRRASQELLRLMIDGAKDHAFYVLDGENRVIEWNRGAQRLFGYSAQEVLGKTLARTYPEQEAPTGATTRAWRSAHGSQFEEVRIRLRKDGTTFWAQTLTTPLQGADGRSVLSMMTRDITERRILEQELRQAQKMEDFGRLAGGVAHDFNNLLTVINGYGNFLLTSLPAQSRVKEDVQEIVRAGERAASLTRQLLAFSRKQVLEPKILDLNKIVSEMEKMLRRLIGEDVEFVTACPDGLQRIKADPGQVEQVIMNLAVNARDAMPKGGRLTIETRDVELNQAYTRKHPGLMPGRYVLLSVSDTGTGMSERTLTRIFEPFFTTKGPGKGTGLGLSTVFGIVKQSGGHVSVKSEVGKGTIFEVYFPSASGTPTTVVHPAAASPLPPASESVLLVEDETAVRKFARETLERAGYRVSDAANGREALEALRSSGKSVDLLLTDTVMPFLGGAELAEKAVGLIPDLKVIYMSGYAETAIIRRDLLKSEEAFLAKPFGPEALLRKVRAVLSQSTAKAQAS